MKWMVFGAALVSVLLAAAVNAQTETCTTEADFTEVAEEAGISEMCGQQLVIAGIAASFQTDAGVNALNAACTSDCVGAYAQPLLCECGYFIGAGVRTQCYRAGNTGRITFCREAYVDVVDMTAYVAFAACATYQAGGACPAGCGTGLQDIVDEIGCCFQNVLNSTLALSPDAQSIPGAAGFFALIQNSELWNACDVTIPSACPEPTGLPALNQELCDGAVTLLATKAVAVFLILLAYFAM